MAVGLRRKYKKRFDVGRKWYHSASSVPYSTLSTDRHVGKVLMGLRTPAVRKWLSVLLRLTYLSWIFLCDILRSIGGVLNSSLRWLSNTHK